MPETPIERSLKEHFNKHRIVFWYDAGKMYASFLGRDGVKKRVLPDFLIGAYAIENGGRLLARDRGYYRDYFDGLQVIEPLAR